MLSVTKLDAARRQLVTAIRLFFKGGDPVSILTLAANAWEIIDTLCNRQGTDSFSNQTRENLPPGTDLMFDFINKPYRNFFKHADRDPDGVVVVQRGVVAAIVFLAVEDYIRLNKRSPVEAQVFQLWYVAVFPEKLSNDAMNGVLEGAAHYFPGIASLPGPEQIAMGCRVLEAARQNLELATSPQTEPGH